jgi:hypothetical protein
VAFARGDRVAAPVSSRLILLLGNRPIATIDGRTAGDSTSWEVCPEAGYYAARSCPFSSLQPLRDIPGPVAVSSTAPSHPCANPTTLPSRFRALQNITLTPDTELTCVDYVAVQLFVERGQIVAVNLIWAEP